MIYAPVLEKGKMGSPISRWRAGVQPHRDAEGFVEQGREMNL
jgi:hypothetical protein